MTNPTGTSPKVGVFLALDNLPAYQAGLTAAIEKTTTLAGMAEKLATALNSVATPAAAAAAATNAGTTNAQHLLDLEIAYAREKGNTKEAQTLINLGLRDAEISDARRIVLLDRQVEVQKEIAAQILAANAQVLATQQQQGAGMAAGLPTPAMARKQQEETDILAMQAEQAAAMALQKQLEETDLIRAKAAQKAITDGQRTIDLQIRLAQARGQDTTALYAQAEAEAVLAGDTDRLLQLQIRQAEASNRMAQGGANAAQSARGMRYEFLGAALAVGMLQQALGDQLPPAAAEAAKGFRLIADTAMMGFFLSGGNPAGAAAGALVGGILSIGVAALTQEPNIAALGKSIDALAKKDDAVQGLMQLSGVSEASATAALEYAKKNKDVADSFKAEIDAAKPVIPVLQGVGDGFRTAGEMANGLNQALEKGIPIYGGVHALLLELPKDVQDLITYDTAYKDELLKSGNVLWAQNAGLQAVQQSMIAGALTTKRLADATNDLAVAQAQTTLNTSGNSLGANLLDAQQANWNAIEAATEAHYVKLTDIAQAGVDAREKIEQTYSDRLVEINDTRLASEADALTNRDAAILEAEASAADRRATLADNLAQSIKDAEEQGAQRRVDTFTTYQERLEVIAQSYADRRFQIEQAYQNAIEGIQDTYQQSIFNAITKQDAKGLVMASMAREAALRKENETRQQQSDALDKQHAKDLLAAQEAYEKAQRAQSDALAKQEERLRDTFDKQSRALEASLRAQEEKINDTYEKRIKALEDAATKEKEKAADARDKALAAQALAENKALDTEAQANRLKEAENERAYALSLRKLADALADTKGMTIQNGIDIITALRGIFSPDQAANFLIDFVKAMQAKVDITVVPWKRQGGPDDIPVFAEGGYTGAQSGRVHPNELVLPLGNEGRTQQLMQAYIPPRVMQNMPAWAMSQSASSANNSGELHVHVHMDNSMLNATIEAQTENMLMQIIPQVHQNLNRM